eukprot:TRINITY_DN22139_c0_g1_i1.p1 TRINITY_DN22139_c0_g1~~TRINITY_DN22139_c0_g1_i1.p1  ORF type:complete len:599 (+),score=188.55 TRINITY_DN22139_c0_g1_i1:74-1798(+)
MEGSEKDPEGQARDTKVTFSAAVDSITYEVPVEPVLTDIGQVDSVGTRLYEKGLLLRQQQQRRQELEGRKQKQEERQAKKATPWVTDQARDRGDSDWDSFIKSQEKWAVSRAGHRTEKEKEFAREDKDLSEVKKKWSVDPVSEQIVGRKKSRGDYSGPQTGWKTSFSKYIKSKNMQEPQEDDFEPTINISSKQIVRDVPTHERLHALAAEREESLLMLRAWEYDKSLIDPATGAPRFHPKILHSPRADAHYESARIKRHQSSVSPSDASVASSQFSKRRGFRELIDHLHEKKDHSVLRTAEVSPECTFAPQTNPTSALILERSGYRPPLYQSTEALLEWGRERSLSPGGAPPPYSDGERSVARSPQERTHRRERRASFMARQFRDQYEKNAKQKELKEELAVKELSQCTFRPRISKKSDEIFRKSKYSRLRGAPRQEPKFQYQSPKRQGSRGPELRGEESETAAFIRQLEADHARDREAATRARMARSASPNSSVRAGSPLSFSPEATTAAVPPDFDDDAHFDPQPVPDDDVPEKVPDGMPSPFHSPDTAPSPFLSTLQNELKTVIDGWKDFDL